MGMFSLSSLAWVLALFYLGTGAWNFYHLMNPLARVDLDEFTPEQMINPFWNLDDKRQLKVYISQSSSFSLDFLAADEVETTGDDGSSSTTTMRKNPPAVLLWDEMIDKDSKDLSKVLVLQKRCDDDVCTESPNGLNHTIAADWFNPNKNSDAMSGSFILKAFEKVGDLLNIKSTNESQTPPPTPRTISVTPSIWDSLMTNRTVHIHVLLIRNPPPSTTSGTLQERIQSFNTLARRHDIILDTIKMVKHDAPRPIKPSRILFYDLTHLVNKHLLKTIHPLTPPPWNLAKTQPEPFFHYQKATLHKKMKVDYPYWKPELSILLVPLTTPHPTPLAGLLPTIRLPRPTQHHPSGFAYLPPTHVDEIGLTSEKYIPLNSSISSLPLQLDFSPTSLSPERWRLLRTFEDSLKANKEMGFDEEDIDDMRRLIADTNVGLLAVTIVASVLHLLFEFLTFKSDVEFWKDNEDITGLSVRALFVDVICQFVILLYLMDKGSSLLVTVPSGLGVMIAVWKCQRGSGLGVQWSKGEGVGFLGVEIVAKRLTKKKTTMAKKEDETEAETTKDKMEALSIETDRLATLYIGSLLLPLILFYAIYTLVNDEHTGWYSYVITTLSSAVYAVGFVFMTPQLFLNYKLKSVAHLPWKVLCYKFLNTFIDDLFAFIIRMPTMARISCFRDDVVFFIYLYQRWLYDVDESRPVEGGGAGKKLKDEVELTTKKTKEE